MATPPPTKEEVTTAIGVLRHLAEAGVLNAYKEHVHATLEYLGWYQSGKD